MRKKNIKNMKKKIFKKNIKNYERNVVTPNVHIKDLEKLCGALSKKIFV